MTPKDIEYIENVSVAYVSLNGPLIRPWLYNVDVNDVQTLYEDHYIFSLFKPLDTLVLLNLVGGMRLSIPKHVLKKHLPVHIAEVLQRAFNGENIEVPIGRALKKLTLEKTILKRFDKGYTVQQLARKHNMAERTIYMIINGE